MTLRACWVIVAISLVLVASACAGDSDAPSPSPHPPIGGTLRVGISGDEEALAEVAFVDPAAFNFDWMASCCLARTLMSFPGRSTAQGGTVLQPDLAAGPPEIARDGLTWTFRLREGIRYAPPYDTFEVTATDMIATVERHARATPDSTFRAPDRPFGFVVGAADYAAGSAPNITGLAAPDPHTLVIRLLEPFGAFGILLADMAWSPQPAQVLADHGEDLGRHFVSTGPYMFESYPGEIRDGRLGFVRNPQWRRESDPRRGAWVDGIDLTLYGEPEESYALVESGELDLADWPVTADDIARYRDDPAFRDRLRSSNDQVLFWLPMNLAVPPFDDVAVRRAANAVVDRAAMRDLITTARAASGRPQPPGVVSQHVFPDSLTGGLLLTYQPWASAGDHGDVGRARSEMAASLYDSDGDGMCDAPACRGIVVPAMDPAAGEQLRTDLALVGIDINVVEWTDGNDMRLPSNRTALQVQIFGWGYNLTGSDLAQLLRGGAQDEEGLTYNMSLVGASPEDLAGWGYEVTEVPSVDDLLAACDAEVGHLRARCWARLDQYVTDVLVPWVPLHNFESAWLVSERVASFSLDQSLGFVWVALDQVSLEPGAGR